MKKQIFILAWLILVLSSVTYAQKIHVVASSTASFGHDRSYAWSQENNPDPVTDSFLVDEAATQINLHLTHVGLWPDQGCAPDVLVVLSKAVVGQARTTGAANVLPVSSGSAQNVGNFVVELYDGRSKQLLWRGVAEDIPIEGKSTTDKRTVDRTVDRMFVHFPYYLNGWTSAERR
jgi:hypothetical protein